MKFLFFFFLASFCLFAAEDELLHRKINFAAIPRTAAAPVIDGDLSDAAWQDAHVISNFILTAGDHGATAKHPTKAFLTWDDTHLYVAFRCEEPDVAGMKTTSKLTDDLDILYDDRVEVFLDVNHDHRSYIELALNSAGVQFDQTGFNRLNGSKTCDMAPSFNAFWRARTVVGQDFWTAELAIDATSLGIAKIEQGMTWGLNLARVRQPDIVKGEEFFKREPAGEAEYSAWAPVNDYIRETISNFHEPLAFGDVVFGDPGFEIKELAFKSALYAFGPVGHPSLYGLNPLDIDVATTSPKKVEIQLRVEPESLAPWQKSDEATLTSGVLHTEYFIPERQENKIILSILDAETKQQLYRTSYIEIAPPFIEFNLYSLYTRNPQTVEPVAFRLLMDENTRRNSSLELKFKNAKNGMLIAVSQIDDLSGADQFTPVFDTPQLRALPGGAYAVQCLLKNAGGEVVADFTQNLTKFDLTLPTQFTAEEGDFSYGGITNHAIRIRYPFAAEFVFWRDASYIPIWDMDQAAMTNEFIECWGAGNQGCNEPMQDRECRYSRVQLLEKSPARAVVHWRYALSDPHYNIYRNEWVDEYYTMYPDGVGVRQVNLWPNSNTRHEMLEVLLAKPPMVHTQQMYDDLFATLTNLKGESHSNKEFTGHKKLYNEFLASDNDFIIEVHFKDRMHPFTVFSFRDSLLPGVTRDHVTVISKEMASADQRGHWPASRYQIDGYNTVGLDVPNHGNIGNIQAEIDPKNQPQTWTFLIGAKEKGSDVDKLHAASWLYPADVAVSSGWTYAGYDESERAYVVSAEEFVRRCEINLKSKKGVFDPVLRFENPGGKLIAVRQGKKALSADSYAAGASRDGATVVFVKGLITGRKPLMFEFEKQTTQLSQKK